MIKNNKVTFIHLLETIIKLAFTACPIYLTISICMGVLHGVSNGAITLMTQYFFNSISVEIYSFRNVMVALFFFAITLILNHVFNGLHNGTIEDVSYKISGYMNFELHKKSARLGTLYFEDSNNLNEIEKAKEGVINSTFYLNIIFIILTQYCPYYLFMTIFLYRLKPILAISIILIFIPVACTQFIRGKLNSNLQDTSAPLSRKYNSYERCLTNRDYFKETRILGAYVYFRNLYCNTIQKHNNVKWEVVKKVGFAEIIMKGLTLSGYIVVLFLFVSTLLSGDITIGDFVSIFTSINTMFVLTEQLICNHIGRLSEDWGSIRNFVSFLEKEENVGVNDIKDEQNISLEKVSFKYPNSKEYVIKDIDLTVNAGETLAIVGDNGAGKSTLVKLMIGLYKPSDGAVKIGDTNTKDLNPRSIVDNVSAVVQNFQRYMLSLKDNIIISDMRDNKAINTNRIDTILAKVDLPIHMNKFNHGINTMLSREFGGVDMSGGEWQKISIARGLYKNSSLIVLDEPTASIDPNEETKLYNMFFEIAADKTTVLVTHRLGCAKIADKIIVLDKGRIIEQGSHDELIYNDGVYAKMYHVQREMYQGNV